jgi:serine/threonine protein kinase
MMQTLQRLEFMHDVGYIHRDLKPENIMVGNGKKAHQVFLIDFGLAKRYICPSTGHHIKPASKKGVFGTTRYLSKNAHLGNE